MNFPDHSKLTPDQWRPPLVVLAGVGMGGSDITPRVLEWIERAEVLAGGSRLLESFPDHPGRRLPLKSPLSDALEHLDHAARTRRTVVLASGDPFFFGIGRQLAELLGRDRLLTFPNVTTVQALFGKLAEPWDNVRVFSLHGRRDEGNWLRALGRGRPVALYTDSRHHPAWIARRLLDLEMGDCSLAVAEDLGLPGERLRTFSPIDAADLTFSALNVVAVFPDGRHARAASAPAFEKAQPVMGLPEESFRHRAGLITKTEVRAVVLGCLQLAPDLVLWDLGAGSGSVSIEAARIAPLRKVIAVERNPERCEDIRENVRRFRRPEIEVVEGAAPQALAGLPDPDRVFVGGSGEETVEVLQEAARRLRPGGRVVQTAVTLETLDAARSFWRGKPFDLSITQIQVSRSSPIGSSLMLKALNPVFIISAGNAAD